MTSQEIDTMLIELENKVAEEAEPVSRRPRKAPLGHITDLPGVWKEIPVEFTIGEPQEPLPIPVQKKPIPALPIVALLLAGLFLLGVVFAK